LIKDGSNEGCPVKSVELAIAGSGTVTAPSNMDTPTTLSPCAESNCWKAKPTDSTLH